MLKKSASGVLASLRGSTYRSVRLAPSLAAALLDSLFEHPDVLSLSTEFFRKLISQGQPSHDAAADEIAQGMLFVCIVQ
jgi:hypothetical protein